MDDKQHGRDWREWAPPPPFVTHDKWADIREEVGALKNGQAHILQTYTHIRGEMREGFDRLERAMTARQIEATATAATTNANGITLSVRELVLLIVAIGGGAVILSYSFLGGHPEVAVDVAKAATQ